MTAASMRRIDTEASAVFRNILIRSVSYALAAFFISITIEKTLVFLGVVGEGFQIEIRYNLTRIVAGPGGWDQESVLLIYLIPFFIQIFFFIFLNIRFRKKSEEAGYRKIFTLWLIFFILYRLFGLYPSHMLFKTGIYYAIRWLYLGQITLIITSILAVVIFLASGYKILRGLMALNGTYHHHIRDMGIPNLLLAAIIYPLASVILVSGIFFLPEPPYEELTGLVAVSLLALLAYFRFRGLDPVIFSYKEVFQTKTQPLKIMAGVIAGIIVLRALLAFGLSVN